VRYENNNILFYVVKPFSCTLNNKDMSENVIILCCDPGQEYIYTYTIVVKIKMMALIHKKSINIYIITLLYTNV